MPTERSARAETRKIPRLLREPTLHFFVLAAAALLGQRLIAGDPRVIELTPALEADLLRRYRDQLSRPPTQAEADAMMAAWKADEALYREALRQGLDRDDPAVRNLLIAKMRERLLLQTRLREPTAADLQQYLEQHRDQFESPLIFEHEYVTFDARDPHGAAERARLLQKLTAGATPASLGLRSTAANVSRERITQDFGPDIAERIAHLTPGQWTELSTSDRSLLVKLIRIQGGLPEPEILNAQLGAAWKAENAQRALQRAVESVAGRYRFQEKSP
jgi:PPIC-type PPIASE domain